MGSVDYPKKIDALVFVLDQNERAILLLGRVEVLFCPYIGGENVICCVFGWKMWMELGLGRNRWVLDSSGMKLVILVVRGRSRKSGDSSRDVFMKNS